MMWLTWIIGNWRIVLIGFLTACLAVQSLRLQTAIAERDAKIAELKAITADSIAIKSASDRRAKEINDGIPYLVEQAKKNAIENFKKRYPSGFCAAGHGLIPRGMPADSSDGQANSSIVTNDPPDEFVADCATDARRLQGWQDWARAEGLEVK